MHFTSQKSQSSYYINRINGISYVYELRKELKRDKYMSIVYISGDLNK